MAEIGSEYGVPHYKCTVKKQKLEHHKHEDYEQTDAEACEKSSLTISMTCKAKGIWTIN